MPTSSTVYHPLLRIAHHVQHPVQKQGRPVPNRRLGQHSGQAECLNERERTNHLSRGLDAIRDSRIASQDGFRDTPWSCSTSEVRSQCVSTKVASVARAK